MRKIFTIFSVIALFIFTSFETGFASKPHLYQTPDISVSSITVENSSHLTRGQSIFIKTTLHVSGFNSGDSIKLDSLLKNRSGSILEQCAGSFPITRSDTRMSGRETITKTCRFDYFKSIAPDGERFTFISIADKSNHIRESNEHNNSQSKTLTVGKKPGVCENARKQLVCGRRSGTRKTFNSLCELEAAGYTYDSVGTCSTRPPVEQPPYERPTFNDDYTRNPIDLSYTRPTFRNDYKRHPINTHYTRSNYSSSYHRNNNHHTHTNYYSNSQLRNGYVISNNNHNYHTSHYSHSNYHNNTQYDSVNYSYNDRINYNSYSQRNHYYNY